MWDNKGMYYAYVADDDIHYQQQSGYSIWKDDSFQMAFDPGRENGPGSLGNWFEDGVALRSDGTVEKWRWLTLEGMQTGAIADIKAAVVRDDEQMKTTYEVFIPWTELLPAGAVASAGDLYGFSVIFNENDGRGRSTGARYFDGIVSAKTAEDLGDLVLLDLTDGQHPGDPVQHPDGTDVQPDKYEWAKSYVNSLYANQVISVTSDEYRYGDDIKYGEFVDMLLKALDFENSDKAWETARELNIVVEGKTPEDLLPRQNMFTILARAMEVNGILGDANTEILSKYIDFDDIADFAKDSIAKLSQAEIVSGNEDGYIYPERNATCAEAAVLIAKLAVVTGV